ncbi:MAG: hypothetical protein KDD67_14030 [Ignavibacteriae bacterium]|nr:hypothetical protein [Ignavibacteriota bacterium]
MADGRWQMADGRWQMAENSSLLTAIYKLLPLFEFFLLNFELNSPYLQAIQNANACRTG